jgi:hypothetical protein
VSSWFYDNTPPPRLQSAIAFYLLSAVSGWNEAGLALDFVEVSGGGGMPTRVPKIWHTWIYDFGFTIYELEVSGLRR